MSIISDNGWRPTSDDGECFLGSTSVDVECYWGPTSVDVECYWGPTSADVECYWGPTSEDVECYWGPTSVDVECYCSDCYSDHGLRVIEKFDCLRIQSKIIGVLKPNKQSME